MAHDGQDATMADSIVLPDLLTLTRGAVAPAEAVLAKATERMRALLSVEGRVSGARLEQHQTAAHGLAWLATYVESLRQMQAWADRYAFPFGGIGASNTDGDWWHCVPPAPSPSAVPCVRSW